MPHGSYISLDEASRHQKAEKIISILRGFTDLSACDILDIGTGSGQIARHVARHCKQLVSVDSHDHRVVKDGYSFKPVDDESLPSEDEKFDIVISNHVIEHLPDRKRHLAEIRRVLKPKGLLYLAFPNRFFPVDPHYRLPFISWLPRKTAVFYLKAVRDKLWDIYPVSLSGIKAVSQGFEITDCTPGILKDPDKYNIHLPFHLSSLLAALPRRCLRILSRLSPTHILMLRKK